MVELLENRVEDFLHISEVNRPAHDLIQGCMEMKPQGEGVAMDSAARIIVGCVFEPHCAVEGELLPDPVVRAVKVCPAAGGLIHCDPAELGKGRFELCPNPRGDVFARGVLEAGNVVQASVVKLRMDGCPSFVEKVVVDGQVSVAQVRTCVQQHFKPVPVHTAALVPLRDIRQSVSGLKDVASPNVCMVELIKVYAFMQRALYADIFNAGHIKLLPNPPGQVFVGG